MTLPSIRCSAVVHKTAKLRHAVGRIYVTVAQAPMVRLAAYMYLSDPRLNDQNTMLADSTYYIISSRLTHPNSASPPLGKFLNLSEIHVSLDVC